MVKNTNKNEIVLIYPKTGADSPDTVALPLSLLLLSAKILKYTKFKIFIYDQRVDKHWEKRLEDKLCEKKTLCVGFSAMTGTQIRFALKAAKLVRKIDPNIPLVWGGAHPTLAPDETIVDPLVDIVVTGEGEDTFFELCNALYGQKKLENISGLYFKDSSGKVSKTKDRFYADLSDLPEIPYHLVDINNYFYEMVGEKALPMLFSRGCPHRCKFCYRSKSPHPKWRPYSIQAIMQQMRVILDLGAKTIVPLDDNFFVDKERVKNICIELKNKNININFHVNCRIDYVDIMSEDYLITLRESGFKSWDFGVESGCQTTLDFINKDLKVEQIHRVNRKLKKLGIIPTYSFMGGFPKETYSDLKQTIDMMFYLIKENPDAYISPIKVYTPFPNTIMSDELPKSFFIKPKSLREWAAYDYNTPHIVWHTKRDTKTLQKISYYSYFIDIKRIKHIFAKTKVLEALLRLYANIAQARLKKDFFFLPIDFYLMRAFYLIKKVF